MKIIRVRASLKDRHFLVSNEEEAGRVALKLLNERRTLDIDADNPKLKEFVQHITDEQDGDLAMSLVRRHYDIEAFSPEVI